MSGCSTHASRNFATPILHASRHARTAPGHNPLHETVRAEPFPHPQEGQAGFLTFGGLEFQVAIPALCRNLGTIFRARWILSVAMRPASENDNFVHYAVIVSAEFRNPFPIPET